MAKKKTEMAEAATVIEPQNAPEAETPEAVEEKAEEAAVPTPATEANIAENAEMDHEDLGDKTTEDLKEEVAPRTQDFSAIPPQAVDYLKRHPEVDAIYIDKFGGMFSKNTPKVFAKDAVLYHNPYFKQ